MTGNYGQVSEYEQAQARDWFARKRALCGDRLLCDPDAGPFSWDAPNPWGFLLVTGAVLLSPLLLIAWVASK